MIYKDNRPEEDSDELWDESPAGLSDQYSREREDEEVDDESYRQDIDGTAEPDDFEDDGDFDEPEHPAQEENPASKRRRRFFGLGFRSSEEHNDYFSETEYESEPEPAPKPKAPKLDPEDPDYWMGEESEIPRIVPSPKKVWGWWVAASVVLVGLLVWAWIWLFCPYVEEAVQYGYVEDIRREGTGLKTFEGVMLPYREIHDTTRVYREDFRFSVADDATAARLKGMMLGCVPARVEYRKYHISLPWRGDQTVVIVKADTADPALILPPEFR